MNRRGASTPLRGVESCSLPSSWPNPIPAIPPNVVRTPHLHGAPTTEETSFLEKTRKKKKERTFFSRNNKKWTSVDHWEPVVVVAVVTVVAAVAAAPAVEWLINLK